MKNMKNCIAHWFLLTLLTQSIMPVVRGEGNDFLFLHPPTERSCDKPYPNLNKAIEDLARKKSRLSVTARTPTRDIYALEQKFHHCIFDMINQGADVNYKDPKSGVTPAILAAFWGQPEILELLRKKGAHMDAVSNDGYYSVEKIQNSNPLSP